MHAEAHRIGIKDLASLRVGAHELGERTSLLLGHSVVVEEGTSGGGRVRKDHREARKKPVSRWRLPGDAVAEGRVLRAPPLGPTRGREARRCSTKLYCGRPKAPTGGGGEVLLLPELEYLSRRSTRREEDEAERRSLYTATETDWLCDQPEDAVKEYDDRASVYR